MLYIELIFISLFFIDINVQNRLLYRTRLIDNPELLGKKIKRPCYSCFYVIMYVDEENINGTLNLKGQDGKTIDIVSELKNNPQMLRQVSGMISNEMGVLQKGINVVQRG